jgi:hypothetical protein
VKLYTTSHYNLPRFTRFTYVAIEALFTGDQLLYIEPHYTRLHGKPLLYQPSEKYQLDRIEFAAALFGALHDLSPGFLCWPANYFRCLFFLSLIMGTSLIILCRIWSQTSSMVDGPWFTPHSKPIRRGTRSHFSHYFDYLSVQSWITGQRQPLHRVELCLMVAHLLVFGVTGHPSSVPGEHFVELVRTRSHSTLDGTGLVKIPSVC